ncbi:MAG: crossover junction endodeoxyribonuclease RuvC [Candidatus Binatia bacterium]
MPKSSAKPLHREVILGIDPGSLITGWGLIELIGTQLHHLAHGTIAASAAMALPSRLSQIHTGLRGIIERHQHATVSLEKVFFSRNAQSALKLGQARGVALLAAAERQLSISEYSAAEIKLAVVGYGRASKEQVQRMVSVLLCLRGAIRADAADALASAICHAHRRSFQDLVVRSYGGVKSSSWRDYLETAAER